MPELPEVENVRLELSRLLADAPTILEITFNRGDIRFPMPKDRLRELHGEILREVRRRGKYLLFETPAGYILSHLGMTGSWRAAPAGDDRDHDHVVITFSSGLRLIFRDPRRFGVLDFALDPLDEHPRLKHLGPEPLDGAFTAEGLFKITRARKSPVKNVIMDASTVVGVGNIYASEALFRAGIRPARRADRVTRAEIAKLVDAIREVLREAIAAGGSTISDYVRTDGAKGGFQDLHRVYDREGEPCRNCGTAIRQRTLSGRSSYYCPNCQR